jgi:hypothetical protein
MLGRYARKMKTRSQTIKLIAIVTVCIAIAWVVISNFPHFADSKSDRLSEDNLPRIEIENGRTVYCRMKADDFRFPLPEGATGIDPQLSSGGFDTVKGSVRVRFTKQPGMSAERYQEWLRQRLQTGGIAHVDYDVSSSDLIVNFSYFGDK